jgi:hypothetical protein
MMVHHDSRDYNVAVGEAAVAMRKRLEDLFHAAGPRVGKVIEQVEKDVPQDAIVQGKTLAFHAHPTNGLQVGTGTPNAIKAIDEKILTIHPHALEQISYKAKIDHLAPVVRDLKAKGEWGQQLAAHALNEVYGHMNGDHFLLRSVRGELRGFLSDQYRRLDSRPLLESFVNAMEKYGARPTDGFALMTKIRIRAMLPMVFEPYPGEIVAFGAELADSDYGDGKLMLSGIMLRMWCTNLAVTEDVISQVHLGKRLSENLRLSQKTYELDTQTMSSAINDLASGVLGPDAVNRAQFAIRKANEEKIEPSAIKAFIKKNLNKSEGEAVSEKFSSADVEMLPSGQTKWRFSNALSWLANSTQEDRRKAELQDLAGAVLA